MPPIWIFLHKWRFWWWGCLSCHYRADSLQRMIARRRLLFTWPAWTWFCRGGGARHGERSCDQWQGGGGKRRKWSELVTGKAPRWVSFKIEPRSLSGREKAPCFLQTVNRLWLPAIQRDGGTGNDCVVWQTPPSSSYRASCATIWFERTVAMETALFDWRHAFGGEVIYIQDFRQGII